MFKIYTVLWRPTLQSVTEGMIQGEMSDVVTARFKL